MSLSSPWVLSQLLLPSQLREILCSWAQQRGYKGRNKGGSRCQDCLCCASLQASPRGPWCQPRVTGCNIFRFLPASSLWPHSHARGCSRGWQQIPPPAQKPSLLLPSLWRLKVARPPTPPLHQHKAERPGHSRAYGHCKPGKLNKQNKVVSLVFQGKCPLNTHPRQIKVLFPWHKTSLSLNSTYKQDTQYCKMISRLIKCKNHRGEMRDALLVLPIPICELLGSSSITPKHSLDYARSLVLSRNLER